MYPPPNQQPPRPDQHPTPSPFGPGGAAPPPVPFSATALLICGVFKLIGFVFLLALAALVAVLGTAFDRFVAGNQSGWLNLDGVLGAVAGGVAVVLLCAGAMVLASALLDVIGGRLALKGKASGRVLGIISAVFGLLGALGGVSSLWLVPTPASADPNVAHSGYLGNGIGVLLVGGFNLYLLVSFVRNEQAFRR